MDVTIQPILEKALAGQRLDFDDGLTLYKSHDLLSIGNAADQIRQRLHPEDYVTYIVDRNINYTNWCYIDCDFCGRNLPNGDFLQPTQVGDLVVFLASEKSNYNGGKDSLEINLYPALHSILSCSSIAFPIFFH